MKIPEPKKTPLEPQAVRVLIASGVFACIIACGTLGYWLLGHGRWAIFDCFYMSVATIATVGLTELPQIREVPYARGLTVLLIFSGIGAIAYMQSALTALLVEGVIGKALRRKRMRKAVNGLHHHVVVAGAGSTGRHVIEDLVGSRTPFVVIDRNLTHLERLARDFGPMFLYVHGDATEDHILLEAGVDRAKGVVAALTHDKDNLFVTLSARSLNADARIVAKVVEDEAGPKMLKAGATSIVSPTMIGGRRMASDILRPEVTEFLDSMLRDKERRLRLEEIEVKTGSALANITIREAAIRSRTRVLIVAVRGSQKEYLYNPAPDFCMSVGSTLIVLGEGDDIDRLRVQAKPSG